MKMAEFRATQLSGTFYVFQYLKNIIYERAT